MWLIVGLGNPGKKYSFTRHNMGFMVLDVMAYGELGSWSAFNQHALIFKMKDRILAKPQTFMNLSGEAVQSLKSYYQVPMENIIVIQDDIDLPFGQMRFHYQRGHGGHNGIRSIHQHLGPDYVRLKLGIQRPSGDSISVADYVLSSFHSEEKEQLQEILVKAGEAIHYYIENGLSKASSKYNQS